VFVVEDAQHDPDFSDNPLVTGPPHIRFYAGTPLRVGGGAAVGSLCIIDSVPRLLSAPEKELLRQLGKIVTDIMELRIGSLRAAEYEASIQRERDLLAGTIENAGHGIGLFDASFQLIFANERLFDLLGTSAVPKDGTGLTEIFANVSSSSAEDTESLVRLLTQEGPEGVEVNLSGKIMKLRWRPTQGNLQVLSVEDVSEYRMLERMKEQFITTVSHEFRTPLTSLTASVALLQNQAAGSMDYRSQKLVKIAKASCERLDVLVAEIVSVKEVGAHGVPYEIERLDVARLLQTADELYQNQIESLRTKLEIEAAESPLWIFGDARRLLQAIGNLIANAARYSPEGASVKLGAEPAAKFVRISVSDEGAGVPEEFRPHLFEQFSRAQSAGDSHRGAGLGLAIVKEIAERHGGLVGYESAGGNGSRFWIDLPRRTN
jgi:signal transduction histidine kinase